MPLKKEFLTERQGKEFVLYAGLLDLAHQEGLKEITTEIVQLPTEANGNTAVVLAKVTTERGSFAEMGDACPTNVNRMMLPHLLRMASTRAKARALRDAVNVGVAALEELGDTEEQTGPPSTNGKVHKPAKKTPREYYAELCDVALENNHGDWTVLLALDAPDAFIVEKGKELKSKLIDAGLLH